MILEDLILAPRVNQTFQYSGIDSVNSCLDKKHFNSYPYRVEYQYNSRGFRDLEWPNTIEELKNSIWCFGDSFTVGLGSPREHTWVYQLEKISKTRTINVSLDGASNQWLARKAIRVLQEISPAIMVIQWTYLHRYEINDESLEDTQRRGFLDSNNFSNDEKLLETFNNLIAQVTVSKRDTKIVHSFVPGSRFNIEKMWEDIRGNDWPSFPKTLEEFYNLEKSIVCELKDNFQCYNLLKYYCEIYYKPLVIPEIIRLDIARDGHHYDLLTAQQFAKDVQNLLLESSRL